MSQEGEIAADASPAGKARAADTRPARSADRAERSACPRGPAPPARALLRASRSALVTARRPSHGARLLPGFLIVGAARCGTTSMSRALSQHPAICGPALLRASEVHYFDWQYHRGLAWYQSNFPLRVLADRAARPAGVAPVAFESGPYYMFHPLAPARIGNDLPGVKLLVLVRDPVERAYSAHANRRADGCEAEPFERALELEDSRLEGEAERVAADPAYISHGHRHHAYRTRGQYAEQLEHLEKTFGRERIRVVDSGDFFADPRPAYDGVLEFIGLPHRGYPVFGRHNARPRSDMPQTVRAALEEHYRPYDERLTSWLGGRPSWRR